MTMKKNYLVHKDNARGVFTGQWKDSFDILVNLTKQLQYWEKQHKIEQAIDQWTPVLDQVLWYTLLYAMLDMEISMKLAPASTANAFAIIDFPVPSGPYKRIPLQGCICIEKRKTGLVR